MRSITWSSVTLLSIFHPEIILLCVEHFCYGFCFYWYATRSCFHKHCLYLYLLLHGCSPFQTWGRLWVTCRIQFNIRCYDPSFPTLFSNPAIKLLLRGILKVSPSVPDQTPNHCFHFVKNNISTHKWCFLSLHWLSGRFGIFIGYLLLGSGEFTLSSNSFNPGTNISFSD